MTDLAGLKWSQNVNYHDCIWTFPIDSISKIFLLHWNNINKSNALKPQEGELIVIRQYGYVTHIVKVFNNTLYSDGSDSEFSIARLIEVVWVASDLNNAPTYEEVFDCPIIFPGSGKVHLLENIQDFKERWDEHGGLRAFQTYIKGVLDKYGEWKEPLIEL